jgi:hypothetical protein
MVYEVRLMVCDAIMHLPGYNVRMVGQNEQLDRRQS